MLAGIEFGLLHLFPHRVNAFKDMVYFSNGETLFSETFIRFLPVPLTPLPKKIALSVGVGGRNHLGSSFPWEVLKPKAVGTSQAGDSRGQSFPARCHCPAWARRGVTAPGAGLHTQLESRAQGTAGLWPHVGQSPLEAETTAWPVAFLWKFLHKSQGCADPQRVGSSSDSSHF